MPKLLTDGERVCMNVRCFRGFHLDIAGRPLDWSRIRPRVRTLLRYLAVHAGQRVHREIIVAALWPELSARAGINNLQVGISTLRTFLEPGGVARGTSRLIPRDGESYRLAIGDGDRSDLLSFDTAVSAGRVALARGQTATAAQALRDALRLYTGDLLPEDGPAEWVVGERARYRFRAAEAGARLARLEYDAGNWRRTIQVAHRALALDRCNDDSWRLLISAQQRAGHAAAAGRSRHTYERILNSLGVGTTTMIPAIPAPAPGGADRADAPRNTAA